MMCRSCNWYMCQLCQPLSLWNSVSFLAGKGLQELQALQEVVDIVETHGPLSACTTPSVHPRQKCCDNGAEIRVIGQPEAPSEVPCTPVCTTHISRKLADVCDEPTPPKPAARKQDLLVDYVAEKEELQIERVYHFDVLADDALDLGI